VGWPGARRLTRLYLYAMGRAIVASFVDETTRQVFWVTQRTRTGGMDVGDKPLVVGFCQRSCGLARGEKAEQTVPVCNREGDCRTVALSVNETTRRVFQVTQRRVRVSVGTKYSCKCPI
jgi:hypothetical protein